MWTNLFHNTNFRVFCVCTTLYCRLQLSHFLYQVQKNGIDLFMARTDHGLRVLGVMITQSLLSQAAALCVPLITHLVRMLMQHRDVMLQPLSIDGYVSMFLLLSQFVWPFTSLFLVTCLFLKQKTMLHSMKS